MAAPGVFGEGFPCLLRHIEGIGMGPEGHDRQLAPDEICLLRPFGVLTAHGRVDFPDPCRAEEGNV